MVVKVKRGSGGVAMAQQKTLSTPGKSGQVQGGWVKAADQVWRVD